MVLGTEKKSERQFVIISEWLDSNRRASGVKEISQSHGAKPFVKIRTGQHKQRGLMEMSPRYIGLKEQ
jgi:hypothetical protein